MKQFLSLAITCVISISGFGATFHVGTNGSGHPYTQIKAALAAASPGDTVLVHGGIYNSEDVGNTIQNVHGTPNAWYHVRSAPGPAVYIEGNWPEGMKLSRCSYIKISGLKFRNTGYGNMVNIDDGTANSGLTHNILIENCTFNDILGTGNCDILKLTGVDTFTVRNCRFYEGAYDQNQGGDGAGIDMNGCHEGLIEANYFEYPGRFAFQVKGGCHKVTVRRNFFQARPYIPIVCERTAHIGGSHGGPFRPANANYNAKDIWMYSNIFSGGWAPVAFVGVVNAHVINNTFFLPEEWIIRILQEQTVNDAGTTLLTCANNSFRNNIMYLKTGMNQWGEVNMGGSVNGGSFTFSNNLWYKYNFNPPSAWTGPSNLPAPDANSIIGQDPLFLNTATYKFDLLVGSPAIGKGVTIPQVLNDYNNLPFKTQRAIGAIEFNTTTGILETSNLEEPDFEIFPVPCSALSRIYFNNSETKKIRIMDINGREICSVISSEESCPVFAKPLEPGIYVVEVCVNKSGSVARKKFVVTE